MVREPEVVVTPRPAPARLQQPQPNGASSAQPTLANLLQCEGEMRRKATVPELLYFIANETRQIVHHEQMFILLQPRLGDVLKVQTISSIAIVDRNTPLIQAIEHCVATLATRGELGNAQDIDIVGATEGHRAGFDDYPFHTMRWHPLKARDQSVFAGLLLARSKPLDDAERLRRSR